MFELCSAERTCRQGLEPLHGGGRTVRDETVKATVARLLVQRLRDHRQVPPEVHGLLINRRVLVARGETCFSCKCDILPPESPLPIEKWGHTGAAKSYRSASITMTTAVSKRRGSQQPANGSPVPGEPAGQSSHLLLLGTS